MRGRAYDVVAHQQAATPEQLLAPEPADPEHDDEEPEAACNAWTTTASGRGATPLITCR
ncbi:hypothetical protein ACFY8V_15195 [Streptomyces californicus]|uniref:hypothetical protein n=1 Tax=Streptomyces californicus TaxID=67351 RepID=UPI0036AC717F